EVVWGGVGRGGYVMGASSMRTSLLMCGLAALVGCQSQHETISTGDLRRKLNAVESERMASVPLASSESNPPRATEQWHAGIGGYSLGDISAEPATTEPSAGGGGAALAEREAKWAYRPLLPTVGENV